jgi:hypothetical protein
MSSIIMEGDTFHGISVFGRGVFTDEYGRWTYAGQHRDGYACGLGVVTWSDGHKEYAEYGPDGRYDGRHLGRTADGDIDYRLCEGGEEKDSAYVYANGSCEYNNVACVPDDPRLLALIAQVAPVEVRPAAPAAIARHSPPSNRPMDFAPQELAKTVATEVHPRTPSLVAVRHNPTINRTATHDHAVMRARTGLA